MSGAFRMSKKPGVMALEISLNFTPKKGREGWIEIPVAPPGILEVGQVIVDPGGPLDGEVITALVSGNGGALTALRKGK